MYYNANPAKRNVNDCTVRAISLASGLSWDETYIMLSEFARELRIMPDDVLYIDDFLNRNFKITCACRNRNITVGDFVEKNPKGTFLITMPGHITCAIDGVVYDTFDPRKRMIWEAYLVKGRER